MNSSTRESIFKSAWQTFVRFPIPILFAFLLSCHLVLSPFYPLSFYKRFQDTIIQSQLNGFLMAGTLFFISIKLFSETHLWKLSSKLLIHILGFILLLLVIANFDSRYLPQGWSFFQIGPIFYAFLAPLSFLTYAAPFIKKYDNNTFWQFSRLLIKRSFLAAFYCLLIFILLLLSLSLALKFELINENWFQIYLQQSIGIQFFLFYLIFLSGVPKEFTALSKLRDYPRGIRIFAQKLLAPFSTLWILIFIVGSVLIFGDSINLAELKDYLSNFVLVIYLTTLSFCMLFPYAKNINAGLYQKITKIYGVVLLILIAMTLIAMRSEIISLLSLDFWKRYPDYLSQWSTSSTVDSWTKYPPYGQTWPTTGPSVLEIWGNYLFPYHISLLFSAFFLGLYFLIKREPKLSYIPLTFSIFLLLATFVNLWIFKVRFLDYY